MSSKMFGDFDPLQELELCMLELQQQGTIINTLIKEFNTHSEIIVNLAKSKGSVPGNLLFQIFVL
jgi:hypothetical protein